MPFPIGKKKLLFPLVPATTPGTYKGSRLLLETSLTVVCPETGV